MTAATDHAPNADDSFEWPAPSGTLVVRSYRGTTAPSPALLVFFPPGGFVEADLDASDECLKSFAIACRATVLAPSYAVAPEQPFPAAAEDAHAVLTLLAQRDRRIPGWTGAHLFVGGIEAGGNLAAVSTLMARDRAGPALAGQVLIMPMLDPSMRVSCLGVQPPGAARAAQEMSSAYRDYLPRPADRVHPYACPLESSRLAGLPPALLVYAENDALSEGTRRYADKLERAGVAVHRVVLPAIDQTDADARCKAAGQGTSVTAIAEFIAAQATLSRRCPPPNK
jgi:acetyl esterase/lipase